MGAVAFVTYAVTLTRDTEHVGLREFAQEAGQLGHTGIEITRTESGARWTFQCDCGWPGWHPPVPGSDKPRPVRTWATETEAILGAIYHLRRSVKEARAAAVDNGVSLQGVVRPAH